MKIQNKTVLISGGGSGIGFETAKILSADGNKVIIIGRNEAKLTKAAGQLKNVTAIPCDITSEKDVANLKSKIQKDFSDLSVLINNAGFANIFKLEDEANAYDKAHEEISINYLSLVRLTDSLLPILKKQPEAAIVNVSSIVVFAPGMLLPTYSASKAAVHAYTRVLRQSLANTSVKVFELMPPLVDTDMAKDLNGAQNGIPPKQVAETLFAGIEKNETEIHVGATAQIYQLYLSSPVNAFKALNQIA
ncbi:MAG TPA: SDR family NAD(P)-dependent oxidoreductase [Ohtaekwangia sp.]|uniref:SDR family oxidoreductase n=1 Tax=Ohtaekwangia sp. TaxID=2066019 RepID=UPI002F95B4C5